MKQQRGFSLIEMAIVLGVVGLVMGGVWVVVVHVQEAARLKQMAEQLIVINKNVRSYYQTQACIANGDQTGALLGLGQTIFPREMVSGGAVNHAWNGAVQVSGTNGGCDYLFTVTLTGVPPTTCVPLVPQLAAAGEASRGLVSVSINGAVPLTALPPNPTAINGNAAGQCAENATATIALTYKLRLEE